MSMTRTQHTPDILSAINFDAPQLDWGGGLTRYIRQRRQNWDSARSAPPSWPACGYRSGAPWRPDGHLGCQRTWARSRPLPAPSRQVGRTCRSWR